MRRKTIDTIPVLSDAMKNILSAFSKSRSLPSGLVRKSYLSIEELEAGILRFIEQYNLTAHPFKWTYARIPLVI